MADADSDHDLRQKFNVTKDDIERVEQKIIDRDLAFGYSSSVNGLPLNTTEKHAQEYLRERERRRVEKEIRGKNSLRWLWAMSPQTGDMISIQVKLDSGSGKNFITEAMLEEYYLDKKQLDMPMTFDMVFGSFTCYYTTEVSCVSHDDARGNIELFVLPDDPRISQPLIGLDSMHQIEAMLFNENPEGHNQVQYTALSKKTAKEEREAEALRARVAIQRNRIARRKEAYEQRKDGQKGSDEPPTETKKRDNGVVNVASG